MTCPASVDKVKLNTVYQNRRRYLIFSQELDKRISFLREITARKKQELQCKPQGTLIVNSCRGKPQYYLRENGKRTYLRENQQQMVRELCQKSYDQKILAAAGEELEELEKLRTYYEERKSHLCEAIYDRTDVRRRQFIEPVWMPDEEYRKKWESFVYERKGFREDAPEYYSEKGERVRSKTEILIANLLTKYGIPYRYECPLYLNGYGWIHPDFTVLHVEKRKEMYFEHLGMLDDENYREEALKRIAAYEKNGFFPGDRLVLTYESTRNPINSKVLEELLAHYFL